MGLGSAFKRATSARPAAADRTAFHGSLRAGQIYDPGLNRPEYVVHPYRVSLTFLGRPWGGLDVEVSDPEIDPQAHTPHEIDNDLVEFGARFGFGALRPVELVDLEYQVAQKIHAVTDPAYERAHDLVDLQLLWTSQLEMRRLREMCIRTFRWRNQQSWPPLPLRDMTGWARAYAEAREETQVDGRTEVLLKLVDAREWLADMVQSIHADVR